MEKPVVVFVLGGPGAGKGTQCARIQNELGFKHISAGDCLREEKAKVGSDLGELIDGHIRNGTIVPVEITCELLKRKMIAHGWTAVNGVGGKFLIDGFPRNQNNLDGWMKACGNDVEILFCLNFQCPEEILQQRLLSRGTSSGRVDDNIESVKKRFNTFREETTPIIDYFAQLGKCRNIQADGTIEDVWTNVKACFLNELSRQKPSVIPSSTQSAA